MVEMLTSGKLVPFATFDVLKMYPYGVVKDNIVLYLEAIFFVMLVFYIIKEIRQVNGK